MKKKLRAIPLSLLAILLLALPVLAIADPDSPSSVNGVWVYNDLLADGDCGIFIDYYIDYDLDTPPVGTPPPDEVVTEAYMAVFIDVDGTTQLKSIAPYTFVNSGYGRGLVWIYFTAAEVTTHGIDIANQALYTVWFMGNPTLDWAGDPPRTIAGIDYWMPVDSSAATLLTLRILSSADTLELAWSLDMIEETAVGNRLTVTGEGYYTNVIPNVRLMAPSAFASGEFDPTLEDIDYSTVFGAVITDGTGTQPVSPLALVEGANTVDITGTGTFIVELTKGTVGIAEDIVGGAPVTNSPVDLVWGINTITVTLGGTNDFLCTVDLVNTQTIIEDTIIGTGLDLTDVATEFGVSRLMASGLVWLVISIIICAGVYKISDRGAGYPGSGKTVLLIFDICIIGGAVLGLVHPIVAVLMFIGFGALTGYVLFFRGANV